MNNRRFTLAAVLLLLVIAFAMFADLLFTGGSRVLGHHGSDMFLQYFAWRQFGFTELAKGNLALWNPHIFSGAPYFGGMQGAQLYPPNWLFLLLPTPLAITWTTAFHVWAIGCFTLLWLRQRGLGMLPSLFGGILVMFCGAFFPHIFAGHLPQLAAMCWAPLIFLCIDGLFNTRDGRWSLLGMFAVAMQILAGFPQYVFYTGIIAGIYAALQLVSNWNWRVALALVAIYLGGAVLASVQLLPALQTTTETTRGLRLPYEFASAVALPPENLITLFAPDFFGRLESYWGRWYLWETSLFIGVSGVTFVIYALVQVGGRAKWVSLLLALVSLALALGSYTPLFKFLYDWIPGFDRFRSVSKFAFLGSLFLAQLAATGFNRLLGQKRIENGFIVTVVAAAILLAFGSWGVANTSTWPVLMNASHATGQSFLFPQLYASSEFVAQSQHRSAMSLLFVAAVAGVIATILVIAKRRHRALFALVPLAAVEMLGFAYGTRATFDSATMVNAEQKRFVAEHPGDYRIIDVTNPNTAMLTGAQDLWGYDATVMRRYAEFMTWTQRGDPNKATSYVKFVQFDPLFAMLRQGYVFAQRGSEFQMAEAPLPPMPHLQLISQYRVLPTRDAVFDALRAPGFDPTTEVILQSEPDPPPAVGERNGRTQVISESTDFLTIDADLERPSILLITDAYAASWRAVPLAGSVQSKYQLLPANYILRAVPLAAGHHRLRVEYVLRSFVIGKWISIIASLGFVAAVVWFRKHRAPL